MKTKIVIIVQAILVVGLGINTALMSEKIKVLDIALRAMKNANDKGIVVTDNPIILRQLPWSSCDYSTALEVVD